MPPPNLHGLNFVYNNEHEPSSSVDLANYPNNLDLWSNLKFDSDEPIFSTSTPDKSPFDHDEERAAGVASHDVHENVVTGQAIGDHPTPSRETVSSPGNFDVSSFLAGFGIDPTRMPPSAFTPSLTQLMAMSSNSMPPYPGPPPPAYIPTASNLPPTKRRKNSTTTVEPAEDEDEDSEASPSNGGPPLSAAEDKRRRNTAASARFRMKKKEREQALEGKAKVLEMKVNELEKECEGLRRENGWLKGLVVGVTGGGAPGSVPQLPQSFAGMKRGHDEL